MLKIGRVLLAVLLVTQAGTTQSPENSGGAVVWAEKDGDSELPCDILPPHPSDKINMILWFKDNSGIPLYSVDGRYGDLEEGQAALGSDLGGRCNFIRGPPGRLRIAKVKPEDQGIFRCRVDFLNSPSRNFRLNLTLIEPPSEPQILSGDAGAELRDVAGPYLLGHDLHFLCIVIGGEPRPTVSWRLEGKELDGGRSESQGDTISSRLHVASVNRDLHGRRLSCQAQSSPSSTPLRKTLLIQLYLKPENVEILTREDLLSAGRIKEIICESSGSNPPANISWYLDGEPISRQPHQEAIEMKKSRSVLRLRPTWEDDGKELTCRAVNPKYPSEYVEDRMILNVAYAGMAEVKMRGNGELREGEIVKLGCEVNANPPPDNIMWYHGSELLKENGRELELGPLTPESAGQYSCFVRNKEGATRSRPFSLQVRYAPFCKPGTEVKHLGVIPKSQVVATCEVIADSEQDIKFSWTFNRSKEVVGVPTSEVHSVGRLSEVSFTPETEEDMGTLACWAANSAGQQRSPCLVHLHLARRPETPEGCRVPSRTSDKVEVECSPSDDGGLSQQFILQVVSEGEDVPVYKQISLLPIFQIRGLLPGKKYDLHIYSKNAVGISDRPAVINGVQGHAATDRLTRIVGNEVEEDYWKSGGVAGLSVIGALGILIVLIITWRRTKKRKEKKRKKGETHLNNLEPSVRIRYHDSTELYPNQDSI